MSIPQVEKRPSGRAVARVPLNALSPNPRQPRREVTAESIQALAESIRRHGQLTPILVREMGDGYELIAGQRRVLALQLLQRGSADALVLAAGDCDSALIALVENVQREALHYLDEAEACRAILDTQPITQERLAMSLSVSPSALANRLRLLKLPPEVREAVRRLSLSERHARTLLRLDSASAQLELAGRAAAERMSVKRLESAVEEALRPKKPRRSVSPVVRDNRIIINAVMETVRELKRIGVRVDSRVEEREGRVEVVVSIPVG